MPRPRIAITMGDPAGIGPEIVLKAVSALDSRVRSGELELLVIGCGARYRATAAALNIPTGQLEFLEPGRRNAWPPIGFIEAGATDVNIAPGVASAAGGQFAYDAVRIAVRLALDGQAHAICTAPLNKEALNRAGHHFNGHTELLARLTGASDSVMMLAHGNMHVSHVSTHTALRDVPACITPERIRRVVGLTDEALRRLGIQSPRIGVAALNPHAGEGGLFGTEDLEVIAPTVELLSAEGYDIYGPYPGDTIFVKLRAGQFDAVVAMYHDQGHIPIKLLGFHIDPTSGTWDALSGVNITLGLPIVRTSVDHGTAFDIAGKGVANASSLVEAVDFAIRLAMAPSTT